MAGHYQLQPIIEPKIFAKVKELGKALYKDNRAIEEYFSAKDFSKFQFEENNFMRLSADYKEEDDDSVFTIGKFTLQEQAWHEDGNSYLATDTDLECHFDKYGNVTAIYFVA